jgi:hypothetical protein
MESLKSQIAATSKDLRLKSPEWAALLKAIRKGEDAKVLATLGESCLMTPNQVSDIVQAVNRLPRLRVNAARADSEKREWDSLTDALQVASEKCKTAATPQAQRDLAGKVQRLSARRHALQDSYLESQQAVAQLAALAAEGIE